MKYYITIDTGTSNTRIHLLNKEGELIDTFHSNIGVKIVATAGNQTPLLTAIRTGILTLLHTHQIHPEEICKILASGMITSDVGIYELPHLAAPADIHDFRKASKEILIPEISEIPITFIPGLKNCENIINRNNFEKMDMMRGEEVETFAILEGLPSNEEYLLVLPGSHTKFVSIGKGKKILGCLTTLSGELLDAVTNYTLIANSVEKKFVSVYDKEFTLIGYRTAKEAGLSRALFTTRILDKFLTKDHNCLANYLLGAIMQNDMEALQNTTALSVNMNTHILVAGKEPLKQALIDIFQESDFFKTVEGVSCIYESCLSARGAYLIFHSKTLSEDHS